MPRIGIAGKLIILLSVLTLGTLLFASWQLLNINKQEIVSSTLELQTKLAGSLASRVEQRFIDSQKRLDFLKAALLARDLTFKQKQVLLESYLGSQANMRIVALVDKNSSDEILRAVQEGESAEPVPHSGDFWQAAVSDAGGFVWSFEREAAAAYFNFYFRLNESLYLFVKEDALDIIHSVESERFAGTGFAYLLDKNSRLLSAYRPPTAGSKSMEAGEVLATPLTISALQNATVTGSRHYQDHQDQKRYVGSWAPAALNGQPLWILTQQAEEEAYAAQRMLQKRALLMLVFAACAACLAAFYAARLISRPVLKLAEAAREIGKGNFAVQVEVGKSRDELTELGTAFKEMTEKLNEYSRIQLDKLLAEKTKTEAAVNSMAEAVFLLEGDQILLLNDVAKKILDPSGEREEFINLTLGQTCVESRREKILAVWSQAQGNPGKACDLDLSLSDESKYILEVKSRKVELKKGEWAFPMGVLLVMRDVTLEREIEKMKEDFVHMITHDLRSPLQTIGGYTEQMLVGAMGKLEPIQEHALHAIEKGTTRLLNMINNILDSFRLEHGAMEPKLARHDISKIASDVVELFKGKANSKGVELTLKLNGESPSQAESWNFLCDKEMMERVLSNLVNNAINYTPGKGSVTLHVKLNGGEIHLAVADTGEGIAAGDLDKLFKKFGQIHGKSRGGTGLGLLISKKIAEAHGGTIEVASELGKGSTFTIRIPQRMA